MSEQPQDKFLAQMLEGYEKGLEGISSYIEETQTQLEQATARREEMTREIDELKALLGLEEEVAAAE
jgi:hypothetical protein